jgi:transcriptional regulator with XRE-family HTH domain
MFTSEFLLSFKRKALRKGVWFKALDNVERNIINLTAKVVDRVESALLGVTIVKILSKLLEPLKSSFMRKIGLGMKRASEIVAQAQVWGNQNAESWVIDEGFVRYLTLLEMNTTSMILTK